MRRHRTAAPAALLAAASLWPVGAQAQGAPAQPLWELGAVALGAHQQAYPGADQSVDRALLLPFAIYRGRILRVDRETAGVRAFKTERFEFDIGVSASLGASSERIEARRGMADLGTLVGLGPRLKWNLGSSGADRWRAEFPLRAVFDLSDGAAYRGYSFQPELKYERSTASGWRLGTSVSAILGDRRLADTFYTVGPADALAQRPAYAARAGLVAWRLEANFSRALDPQWRLFGVARLDSVAGAANEASPLVRKTTGSSVGIGLAYTWQRSRRLAED